MDNTIRELIYKMECKGFDILEIHFYLDFVWMVVSIYVLAPSDYEKKVCKERLAQAHIEIDFTGYKKQKL